jgi:hypothetical protein
MAGPFGPPVSADMIGVPHQRSAHHYFTGKQTKVREPEEDFEPKCLYGNAARILGLES